MFIKLQQFSFDRLLATMFVKPRNHLLIQPPINVKKLSKSKSVKRNGVVSSKNVKLKTRLTQPRLNLTSYEENWPNIENKKISSRDNNVDCFMMVRVPNDDICSFFFPRSV